jgi:hypothetical protein
MDRIGPAGGSPTVALTNGQQGFQDENLSTGVEGTEVLSAWLNAVQEEFMSILAAAGVTPDIAVYSQVLGAMRTLFGGAGSLGVNGWQQVAGGLILQWTYLILPPGVTNYGVALPISFPNNFFGVLVSFGSDITASSGAVGAQGETGSLGMVYVSNSENSGESAGVRLFALGN